MHTRSVTIDEGQMQRHYEQDCTQHQRSADSTGVLSNSRICCFDVSTRTILDKFDCEYFQSAAHIVVATKQEAAVGFEENEKLRSTRETRNMQQTKPKESE